MDVGSGTLATSSRCWTRRPEGPAAVSLGKERRTERILKSGSRVRGAESDAGATGGTAGMFGFQQMPRCLIIWGNTAGLKDSASFSKHTRST